MTARSQVGPSNASNKMVSYSNLQEGIPISLSSKEKKEEEKEEEAKHDQSH